MTATKPCKLGYARTSTDEQWLDRQVNALREVCDEVFIEDGVSATRKKRPVYDNLTHSLKAGDVLVVLSIDRAFRSTRDALNELDRLEAKGIQFLSLQQHFDSSTPEGKLMRTMMLAVAEFELYTLRQRTKQGLQAARDRGQRLGRPRKLTDEKIAYARQRLEEADPPSISELADGYDVHVRTLERALALPST